jgi:GDPmannose 4,6-dehydratase
MWLMLQAKTPDTYILATGRTETVKDFVSLAFKAAEIDIVFKGKGKDAVGFDSKTNKTILKINPKFYRPAEVDLLIGDPSKAKQNLGWQPKTFLEDLANLMVEADIKRNKTGHVF